MDGRRKVLSGLQMSALDEVREAKRHLDASQRLFEDAVIRAYQRGCSLADFDRQNTGITGSGARKILERRSIPVRTRR